MPVGTIVQLDPKLLRMAPNVRKTVKLTPEFLKSVKEHGVLVPITVQEREDGFDVIDGQRRTLAAVDGSLESVDCYVGAPPASDGDRIIEQIVVNENREQLTNADVVAGVKELELFGYTVAAIEKKTGFKKENIEAAIAVGGSKLASTSLAEFDLGLGEAAALLEFEDDKAIVKDLLEYAKRGQSFIHRVQQYRDQREENAAELECRVAMEALGLTILDQAPSYETGTYRSAEDVKVSQGGKTVPLAKIKKEAGDDLAVFSKKKWGGWNGSKKLPNSFEIAYAVRNWTEHGWWAVDYGRGASNSPKSEEEKEAGRVSRANSKLWVSATTVRIQWLQEFLQRKTAPAGWELIIATELVEMGQTGANPNVWKAATILLGLPAAEQYQRSSSVKEMLKANPAKGPQIAVAIAMGRVEGGFEFDKKGWSHADAPEYLRRLISWGYEPSELEQSIIDEAKSKAAA